MVRNSSSSNIGAASIDLNPVANSFAIASKRLIHGFLFLVFLFRPRDHRLSAAVGVACGVGLLRVATTAAFSTIGILRLGRKTKKDFNATKYDDMEFSSTKYDDMEQKEQLLLDPKDDDPTITNSNIASASNGGHDSYFEPDCSIDSVEGGRDSFSHRLQMTEPEPRPPLISDEEPEIEPDRSHIDFDDVSSMLMEEIVRSAWKHYDNRTVAVLVDRVLSQAGESDYVFQRARNSGEQQRHHRPGNSSDPGLLP